jgi:hypothetical protein
MTPRMFEIEMLIKLAAAIGTLTLVPIAVYCWTREVGARVWCDAQKKLVLELDLYHAFEEMREKHKIRYFLHDGS